MWQETSAGFNKVRGNTKKKDSIFSFIVYVFLIDLFCLAFPWTVNLLGEFCLPKNYMMHNKYT